MLKKRIRMMLVKLGLIAIISVSLFNIGAKLGTNSRMAYANSNTYNVSQSVNQQEIKDTVLKIQSEKKAEIKQNKGKILLYNSHSCERNTDSTIGEITKNLKEKLEKKGYIVEQNLTDFANMKGYNKSYHSSGAWLDTLDLTQYVFIADIHMDGTPTPANTSVKDQDVAKIMFPNVSENPNLKYQTQLVEKIKDGLESFSNNIYKPQSTSYRVGINYYNMSKNPNILLIEVGSDKNDLLSCKRSLTYLVSAIDRALTK